VNTVYPNAPETKRNRLGIHATVGVRCSVEPLERALRICWKFELDGGFVFILVERPEAVEHVAGLRIERRWRAELDELAAVSGIAAEKRNRPVSTSVRRRGDESPQR
jgi:hypothetical protein